MADQIIELLRSKEVRNTITTQLRQHIDVAVKLFNGDIPDADLHRSIIEGEDPVPDSPWDDVTSRQHSARLTKWERCWAIAGAMEHGISRGSWIFEDNVMPYLDLPQRATEEELMDALCEIVIPSGGTWEHIVRLDTDYVYEVFVNYVGNSLLRLRTSEPFLMGTLPLNGDSWKPRSKSGSIFDEEHVVLTWRGIDLSVERIIPHDMSKQEGDLCVQAHGRMSACAMSFLRDILSSILPSFTRSYLFCRGLAFSNEEDIDFRGDALIPTCLDAYFSESTKKDSLSNRIRNAVQLLIDADAQSKNSLWLALSITAIEALLGEKGESIAMNLALNMARLLEPDVDRRDAAVQFMKKLYNARSRVLHGEISEACGDLYGKARHVAAAILHAVISRRDFFARLGESPETPQQLIQDLRNTHFKSGQPDGIIEYNVRQYWNTE